MNSRVQTIINMCIKIGHWKIGKMQIGHLSLSHPYKILLLYNIWVGCNYIFSYIPLLQWNISAPQQFL